MPIIVQIPTPFPYTDIKIIPRRHDVEVQSSVDKSEQPKDGSRVEAIVVTNIFEVSEITCNDIIYTLEELRKENLAKSTKMKRKEVIKDETIKEGKTSKGEVANEKKEKKREVLDEEALEFLNLNNAHLKPLWGIIDNITANNYPMFTNEEILDEGKGQSKTLHISGKCFDQIVARVVDRQWILNECDA
ncbi:hypothetical protein CR513_61161, partial [Mucuna pruriens]